MSFSIFPNSRKATLAKRASQGLESPQDTGREQEVRGDAYFAQQATTTNKIKLCGCESQIRCPVNFRGTEVGAW